jgi:hypothetical protein
VTGSVTRSVKVGRKLLTFASVSGKLVVGSLTPRDHY